MHESSVFHSIPLYWTTLHSRMKCLSLCDTRCHIRLECLSLWSVVSHMNAVSFITLHASSCSSFIMKDTAFICDISCHTWMKCCHVWMKCLSLWRRNSSLHINESCHIRMSHVTYEWVMSHMNVSQFAVRNTCGSCSVSSAPCVTRLIHTYDTTDFYVWHASLTYVFTVRNMRGTRSISSDPCVTQRIHMCATTYSYVRHDSSTCDLQFTICEGLA